MEWTLENRWQLIKEMVERQNLNKERLEKKLSERVEQVLPEIEAPKTISLKEV